MITAGFCSKIDAGAEFLMNDYFSCIDRIECVIYSYAYIIALMQMISFVLEILLQVLKIFTHVMRLKKKTYFRPL